MAVFLRDVALGTASERSVVEEDCLQSLTNKAEWTTGEANPRFVVTSLSPEDAAPQPLYEEIYCARGDMENRIKEYQLDLFADRTSAATSAPTSCAYGLPRWLNVLLCALRRLALEHTQFAKATCGTIRLKLLKIGALCVSACGASNSPWLRAARISATLPSPTQN